MIVFIPMRKKIIYSVGILILVFLGWSIYTASTDTEKSSTQLMAEDALFKKVSGGFYITDLNTKSPVAYSNVTIKLVDDEDTVGNSGKVVFSKIANKDGWVSFSGLEPNMALYKSLERVKSNDSDLDPNVPLYKLSDEAKSNHYVVLADNGSSTPRKVGGCIMGLSEPGHYDSWSIKIEENNGLDNLKTCNY